MPAGPALRKVFALVAFLLAAFSAAAIGGLATARGVVEWYPTLAKPSWTPPSWLFGPVWTVLYAMMGIAAWRVWVAAGNFRSARRELALWGIQLTLNAHWSIAFFGMRSPGTALVNIGLLWLAILATIVVFARRSRAAAWLLAPYLAWVTFAAALNAAVWRLN
jgi:tryptophan-rich sensory protein